MKCQNSQLIRSQGFINNNWVAADSGDTFVVHNPYDGSEICTLPEMGEQETVAAIDAADQAYQSWRTTPQAEKAQLLNQWADLITEDKEDLAVILTTEQGKPLQESRDEVDWSVGHIRYCATDTLPLTGEMLQSTDGSKQTMIARHPFGVVASITPWNFPILTAIEKTVFPIAAGNCVVLKPSDETPLSTLALAYLAQQAGLPAGVLNVVVAKHAAVIGEVFTTSPKVQMISFTGSTRVGKLLYAQAAHTVKKVNLELGGNSPFIVFADADIDKAAAQGAALKFLNAGQVCVNINRFFIHEAVYNEFADKLIAHTKKLVLGSGLDAKTTLGPLLNQMGLDKTQSLVADAIAKGATLAMGGKPCKALGPLFYEPTVLTNISTDVDMFYDEIFGPVAPLYKFSDEETVVAQANDTEFGLAAYFYTRDLSRAWRVSLALNAANVAINAVENYIGSPWGGHKDSGIRGGSGRLHTLEHYFEHKAIAMNLS